MIKSIMTKILIFLGFFCSLSAQDVTKLVLIGPPASGKGTLCKVLTERYQIPQISTGDLLRDEVRKKTPIGLQVEQTLAEGKLVDNLIVMDLLFNRLRQDDLKKGYILDGFPRKVDQASELEASGEHVTAVVVLKVDDESVIKRISGRRVHPGSGRIYHVDHQPPKVENKDDLTGEELVQRDDDKPEIIKKRLELYHSQTVPVIAYYQNLSEKRDLVILEVDAENLSAQEQFELIDKAINQ